MITEDYVSFEVAKLLKEKGFDVPVYQYYFPPSNDNLNYSEFDNDWNSVWEHSYSAPTLQMALKWLREVHKIHIVIYPYGEYSCDNYQIDVYKNNKLVISKDDGYITYEQTVEAALLYVLKNLI